MRVVDLITTSIKINLPRNLVQLSFVHKYYLLSLGSHDVELIHLWFQGLILDPQILFSTRIAHFDQAVLHLSKGRE